MSPKKPCRNGIDCKNSQCPFRHVDTGPTNTLFAANPATPPPPRNKKPPASNNDNMEHSCETPNSNTENVDPTSSKTTTTTTTTEKVMGPNNKQKQQPQRRQKSQQKPPPQKPSSSQQQREQHSSLNDDDDDDEPETATLLSQESSFEGTTATEKTKKTRNIKRRKQPSKKKPIPANQEESASSVSPSTKQQQEPLPTEEHNTATDTSASNPSFHGEQHVNVQTSKKDTKNNQNKKKLIPCRFGKRCNRQPKCPFLHHTHPPETTTAVAQSHNHEPKPPPAAPHLPQVDGTNTKQDQQPPLFLASDSHKAEPPFNKEKSTKPTVSHKKEILCCYGTECRRRSKCPYLHPLCEDIRLEPTLTLQLNTLRHPVHKANTSEPTLLDNADDSLSTKKSKHANTKNCRHGSRCYNKKCSFVHPTAPSDIHTFSKEPSDAETRPEKEVSKSDYHNNRNSPSIFQRNNNSRRNNNTVVVIEEVPTDGETTQLPPPIPKTNLVNEKSLHNSLEQKPAQVIEMATADETKQQPPPMPNTNFVNEKSLHHSLQQKPAQYSHHIELSTKQHEIFKAKRKAAKKERRRLERQAKAGTTDSTVNCQSNDTVGTENQNHGEDDSRDEELDLNGVDGRKEEENNERNANRHSTAVPPAVSRKELKKARYEQFLLHLERKNKERAETWAEAIAKEERIVSVILEFLLAEFVRVTKSDLDRKTIRPHLQETLKQLCSQAYYDLFPVVTRVMIRGLPKKQSDLNDRPATIRYWDASRGMFFVGIDTKKKGKNASGLFFSPENLEPVTNKESSQKTGWHSDPVFVVNAKKLYQSYDLEVDLYKSEMTKLAKEAEQEDLDVLLDRFMKSRTDQEIRQKEEEEYFKRQEAEARRRRQSKLRREQEEYERRRRAYQEFRQEFEAQRKERATAHQQQYFGGSGFFGGGQYGSRSFHFQSERAFREFFSARGFTFIFDYDDRELERRYDEMEFSFDEDDFGGNEYHNGDYDDREWERRYDQMEFSFDEDDFGGNEYHYGDYDDREWDRRYDEMEYGNQQQKLQEAAEILGVDVDASESDIKRVYRRKALLYHPDRFRAEDHKDGTTKEDAEEHIRDLNNAYDLLLSQFDS